MKRKHLATTALAFVFVLACGGRPDGTTIADLRNHEPDLQEAEIDDGIEQAIEGYRKFLDEAPTSSLTPEAMRRLADLQLEKEYGALEAGRASSASEASSASHAESLPAPRSAADDPASSVPDAASPLPLATTPAESPEDFERRTLQNGAPPYSSTSSDVSGRAGEVDPDAGPLEAIALYDQILETYPNYPQNDQVLYQKARAFDELGRVDEGIEVATELVQRYPASRHVDEVQFRRGEYYFTRKKFFDAEAAYGAIVARGAISDYYELALYKLGWTYYKQMLLEEALESYVALLDYKVSVGYDFGQTADEADAQRVADTYRVTSLCFSDLGGAEAVTAFFAAKGPRSYEDRVYRQLGEFYLEKLRYHDAALAYQTFIEHYPFHLIAPQFSMRIVEIYEAGDFPQLVLEAKKGFAIRYGLSGEYWKEVGSEASEDVVPYLKQNLRDLANHYHALYQSAERPEERPAHFAESARWYREYLSSFEGEPETAGIHYRFADLLLENSDFKGAALEYEHVAYAYEPHERSAEAGYAAVFAYREHAKQASDSSSESARRSVVASSLRFADHFPEHEHAARILAAAAEDLYALGDHSAAIEVGHRLIERYPDADSAIRQSTWGVVAHASFDSLDFGAAEYAYTRVLELTPADDDARGELTENLAAAIYKQGEQAAAVDDHRAAADHFLRISTSAPESGIRALAEYDAAAALMRIEDWSGAGSVLETFRTTHPDHELNREATRQLAHIYQQSGDLPRAAMEYERVAAEATDPELQREALLVAGGLHEEVGDLEQAIRSYGDYVTRFTEPVERAVVTRFKMAELHAQMDNATERRSELERIVSIVAAAGDGGTPVMRTYAARSALTLSEPHYARFRELELTQPFDQSLRRKQREMQTALAAFETLIDYGDAEVTAAATYYMGEIYAEFSRSLVESERPQNLSGADLQDYEDALEEEAFPFEDESILIHQKNLELISGGIFNEWVEKSLGRLAVMMPGRYAKHELSTGPLESLETYAYRVPAKAIAELAGEASTADSDTPEGENTIDSLPAAADSAMAETTRLPAESDDPAASTGVEDPGATIRSDVTPGPAAPSTDESSAAVPTGIDTQGSNHEVRESP
jgi:tetratricopeptide (TPR) repeat protein